MKSKRKKLKDKLDELTKRLIKGRDRHICQRCLKRVEGVNSHWAHVIPVSHGNMLRWNFQNSLTLCYRDHINFAHKNPLLFTRWFRGKFPNRYEYLLRRAGKPTRPIKT